MLMWSRIAVVLSVLLLSSCYRTSSAPDGSFSVQVSVSGSGKVISHESSINCGDDCDASIFTAGWLAAWPQPGNVFAGWSRKCSGLDPICQVSEEGEVHARFIPYRFGRLACTRDKWCWENPRPQGNPLRAVWGSGSSDVWAVGDFGIALHWNGMMWEQVEGFGDADLRALWGSGPTDVWILGVANNQGKAWRWDGSQLREQPLPANRIPEGIFGTNATDVWMTTLEAVLHWDGNRFQEQSLIGQLLPRGIWGSSASDVWMVGDTGRVLHWNGSGWTLVPTNTQQSLTAIFGTGPNDVWVGGQGIRLHWDGRSWEQQELPSQRTIVRNVRALWGNRPNEMWQVGNTSAGGGEIGRKGDAGWQDLQTTPLPLQAIWGASESDVWAVGDFGVILHWNGQAIESWTGGVVTPPSKRNFHLDINHIGISDLNLVVDRFGLWAGGDNGRMQIQYEDAWLAFPSGHGWDIDALAPDVNRFSGGGSGGTAISTAAGSEIFSYILGVPVIRSGQSNPVRGMWGTPQSVPWIVGDNGSIQRLGGSVQLGVGGVHSPLHGISGLSNTDIWVTGDGGVVLHYADQQWQRVPSPTTQDFRYVSAEAEAVWLVAPDGIIWRLAADGWQHWQLDPSLELHAVMGRGPSEAWAVGEKGSIWRWDGKSWKREESGTRLRLTSLYTSQSGVWVAGEGGIILFHP